jgi:hypothetical protein
LDSGTLLSVYVTNGTPPTPVIAGGPALLTARLIAAVVGAGSHAPLTYRLTWTRESEVLDGASDQAT